MGIKESSNDWYNNMHHNTTPYDSMCKGIINDEIRKPSLTDYNINFKTECMSVSKDNPYEVFKALESWNLDKDFYLGNVIKYVVKSRRGDKAKQKKELQKALLYLQKRIETL
tara:strand:- start:1260 stop:1595 length:336 start_codon:yes stop_codon:yes gene_type:complete